MTPTSPFDHRPDPELGEALRRILDAGDHAEFTRKVVAAAEPLWGIRTGAENWWDVLSAWARPAVAAALALAAAATVWLVAASGGSEPEVTLEDALRPADETDLPAVLVVGPSPPDLDLILAASLESR
ncbi:MAG: hypothetical protein KatS3mg081_1314 [Gemmatimonadales bacterium]|nr:hypothetical protein HRbin33_00563 [bacterium HR33]GIW51959.1 MAG: hypothetical protein KatS3mg081_1314 [Gemmatimonadales bacterium]